MIKNFSLKEDEKNIQTEPNYKTRYNSIDKINFRKKNEKSKKIHQKNKTLINIHKIFTYNKPSITSQYKFPFTKLISEKSSGSIRSKESRYSYYNLKSEEPNEKEKIIADIFRIQNELYVQNEELTEYRNYYNKLTEQNLTFKVIMERLLNMPEEDKVYNNDTDNNDENETKELENFYINNYTKKESKSQKKKKQRQIYMLKKQIGDYDKSIEKKDKILKETKHGRKIGNFISINVLINKKNKELENLISNSQKLQYSQYDIDGKIDFLYYSIKSLREFNAKLEERLEMNEKDLIYNENEYNEYLKEIEDYNEKIDKLEAQLEILEEDKQAKRYELNKILDIYEKDEEIKKEKELLYKKLDIIINKINNMKKTLEKNKSKISQYEYENGELLNEICAIIEEKHKLNEKIKIIQKNKQNLKNLEDKKKKINEELKKNREEYKKILLKKLEDDEKTKKEIEEFEKAKINLINKINELNTELREKTKKNNTIEEELTKVNEEYNNALKEHNLNH
jgi:hypothetical protein